MVEGGVRSAKGGGGGGGGGGSGGGGEAHETSEWCDDCNVGSG